MPTIAAADARPRAQPDGAPSTDLASRSSVSCFMASCACASSSRARLLISPARKSLYAVGVDGVQRGVEDFGYRGLDANGELSEFQLELIRTCARPTRGLR